MKNLRILLLLLTVSLLFSSCLILAPNRPVGGYRDGYGFGQGYRKHHHHGHHYRERHARYRTYSR